MNVEISMVYRVYIAVSPSINTIAYFALFLMARLSAVSNFVGISRGLRRWGATKVQSEWVNRDCYKVAEIKKKKAIFYQILVKNGLKSLIFSYFFDSKMCNQNARNR